MKSKGIDEYIAKRNFRATSEPTPGRQGSARGNSQVSDGSRRASRKEAPQQGLLFVVQKHHASRLHYDFRLELDGALKSWAVPKGPSLDPADRRLAVHVEDHPLAYADFEGVIPAGEYGAGKVEVWDRGVYAPLIHDEPVFDRQAAEADARQGIKNGKLTFVLSGARLQGAWSLVRTNEEKDEWLLLKHADHAASVGGRARTDLSRLAKDNQPPRPLGLWPAIPTEPMLASVAEEPFSHRDWLFEPKLDGMRLIVFAGHGRAELYSRRGHSVSRQFPALAEQLAKDYLQPVALDGEVVALDTRGAPSFERLQQRLNLTSPKSIAQAERVVAVQFFVFDLLWVDGRDIRSLPLSERLELLKERLVTGPLIKPVLSVPERGEIAYRSAVELGYEGVVAKKADSRYESGRRSAAWLKIKSTTSDDFVIGGYSQGLGKRGASFGALLLGQFDSDGTLRYAGRVGTGFNEATLAEVLTQLEARRQDISPFDPSPVRTSAEVITWTKPDLVAEVRFMHRTRDGLLRAPSFLRLRPDKLPKDTRPADTEKAPTVTSSPRGAAPRNPSPELSSPGNAGELAGLLASLSAGEDKLHLEAGGHSLGLSNLGKVLWPSTREHPAVTKRDFLRYLVRVSPYLLAHVKGRPITLTRYPDGVGGKAFYQRHFDRSRPAFVDTVKVYSAHNGADVEYLLCNNLATLVWLGQMADLEVHTWFSRVDPAPDIAKPSRELLRFRGSEDTVERSLLNYPDFIAFDLDPYTYSGREEPGAEPELNGKAFVQVCRVARILKSMLDSLGLNAYLKTSGKTGLHIYVPILRHFTFAETRAACETIGRYLLKAHPRDVTMTWATSKRTGRVFFDHNMNARSKTVASIYSPRAVGGAGVSTPLRWDELEEVWPLDLNIHTVPERVESIGDLWGDILHKKQDLATLIRTAEDHPVPA